MNTYLVKFRDGGPEEKIKADFYYPDVDSVRFVVRVTENGVEKAEDVGHVTGHRIIKKITEESDNG